jgi:hypothetical protein
MMLASPNSRLLLTLCVAGLPAVSLEASSAVSAGGSVSLLLLLLLLAVQLLLVLLLLMLSAALLCLPALRKGSLLFAALSGMEEACAALQQSAVQMYAGCSRACASIMSMISLLLLGIELIEQQLLHVPIELLQIAAAACRMKTEAELAA